MRQAGVAKPDYEKIWNEVLQNDTTIDELSQQNLVDLYDDNGVFNSKKQLEELLCKFISMFFLLNE